MTAYDTDGYFIPNRIGRQAGVERPTPFAIEIVFLLELQILAALPGIAVEVFLQAASVSVSPLGTSEWGF